MQEYKIFIAGKFADSSEKLDVTNPYTGEVFAQTYSAGTAELEAAIAAAQKALPLMRAMPSWKKYSTLMQIAEELRADRKRLALVLSNESAKPMRYALAEIDRATQTFVVAAEESKRLPKEYISLDWTTAGEGKEGLVKYFPAGIVAGIAPFNFPLNLAVHKIAPAIAAGCPVILKPASSTPLSTLELAKIIAGTDLPAGAVSILPMTRETGNQMVTDPRCSVLSFTGSVPVGWKMKEQSGKKKVILELGGNAAAIVSPTADLATAVIKCLAAGFAYSGQVCIHAQRFFVHTSIFRDFCESMRKGVSLLKYGDPALESTDIAEMIDEENAKRVESWIGEAVAAGATVLAGGNRRGLFVEPTILLNANNSMKVCSQEVFGPVITIAEYENISDAISMVNDSDFGLQASLFSSDQAEIRQCFNEIEAGGIIVNEAPTFRMDHMPYGGVKDSGLGREGVKYAIRDLMEPRILVQ